MMTNNSKHTQRVRGLSHVTGRGFPSYNTDGGMNVKRTKCTNKQHPSSSTKLNQSKENIIVEHYLNPVYHNFELQTIWIIKCQTKYMNNFVSVCRYLINA